MMSQSSHKKLAKRLNQLPDGFPPTESGSELRLLQKLFSPEEAELASNLRLTPETAATLAQRLDRERSELSKLLKGMVRRGLITAKKTEGGLGFAILPFAIGIYEYQYATIDKELAQLVEDYIQEAFTKAFEIQPAVHRVVPIGATVDMDLQVHPYESIATIIERSQAWGVQECLCRNQKALIGDPCDHPLEVCMSISSHPGTFDGAKSIRSLTKEQAYETLQLAADAGLVHSISNKQEGHWYICNCCTCSCGILRGIKEFGVANVVARSPYHSVVDEDACTSCELCLDACQFDALSHDTIAVVDDTRCVGCGLCILACPDQALSLTRRPDTEIPEVPLNKHAWRQARAETIGIDLNDIL
jgi:ferredoxin/predicted transcriptional regulator